MTDVVDPFDDRAGEAAPEIRTLSREQAIEYGRKLGSDAADALGEKGGIKEDRIRRAMAYAAWDYDGRPSSSASQREEMGVSSPGLTTFSERAREWAKR